MNYSILNIRTADKFTILYTQHFTHQVNYDVINRVGRLGQGATESSLQNRLAEADGALEVGVHDCF